MYDMLCKRQQQTEADLAFTFFSLEADLTFTLFIIAPILYSHRILSFGITSIHKVNTLIIYIFLLKTFNCTKKINNTAQMGSDLEAYIPLVNTWIKDHNLNLIRRSEGHQDLNIYKIKTYCNTFVDYMDYNIVEGHGLISILICQRPLL